MNDMTAGGRLTEVGGSVAGRLRATRWDWPLVVIVILLLVLITLFTADLWIPHPFPRV